jgi:hypothetical protein
MHSTASTVFVSSIGITAGDGEAREDGVGVFAGDTLDDVVDLVLAVEDGVVGVAGLAGEGDGFSFEVDGGGEEVMAGGDEDLVSGGGIVDGGLDVGEVGRDVDGGGVNSRQQGQQDADWPTEVSRPWSVALFPFHFCLPAVNRRSLPKQGEKTYCTKAGLMGSREKLGLNDACVKSFSGQKAS